MITTYDPRVVQHWSKEGINPCNVLNYDGVAYWQIDVPKDDARLKHPDYIQLLLQGKLFILPAIIQKRLRLPLYTMTRKGFWVETRIGDDKDTRAIPLSRSKHLIQYAYKGPGVNDDLKLKKFFSKKRLLKTLEQAFQEEVAYIGLIADKGHIESIEINLVIHALRGKSHPGLELMKHTKGGPS
jgi:hypothetical protein